MTREDVIKKIRERGESKADSPSHVTKSDVINRIKQTEGRKYQSLYDEGIQTIQKAYGGWNSAEDMASYKDVIQNAYTRLGRMGMGSGSYADAYRQMGDALSNFDNTANLYSQYLNADAFNVARRKAEIEDKYKGSSYKAIADALKTAQGDERDYLSNFTDYGTTKDFEQALQGAQGAYREELEKAMKNHQLMSPYADYEYLRNNADFAEKSKSSNSPLMQRVNSFDDDLSYIMRAREMTPQQMEVANYLSNMPNGEEALREYLQKMEMQVSKQTADEVGQQWAEWTNQNALTGAIGTLGNLAVGALGKVPTAVEALEGTLLGNYNPYAGASGLMRVKNDSQSALSQSVRDTNAVAGIAYDTLTTGLESRIGQRLFGAPYNLIMGGEAYAQAYGDALEQGADRETATEKALVTGAIETLTEQIGMDWAFGRGKSAIGTVVRQFFAEGSEEVVGDIANLIYDYTRNHDKSEFNQNVQMYMSLGYSEEEATKKAVIDQALETGRSFVVAGLSAGAEGGIHEAVVTHKGGMADAEAMQEALKGSNNKVYLNLMSKYNGDLTKMTDWERGNLYEAVMREKTKTVEDYSRKTRLNTAFTNGKEGKAQVEEDLKEIYEENKAGNENAYDANFELVTEFAKSGMSLQETLKAIDTNAIKASVATDIYNKVRQQVASEVQAQKEVNDEIIKKFDGKYKAGKMDVSALDMKTITRDEKRVLSFLNIFSRLGMDITVIKDANVANGAFNARYNENETTFKAKGITINLASSYFAGKQTDTRYAVNSFAHETTHMMKNVLGAEFNTLVDLAKTYMGDAKWEMTVANRMKAHNIKSVEEAEEEVMARLCEDMFNDGSVADRVFANASESQIKRLVDAIRKWVKSIRDDIKRLMSGYSSVAPEARILKDVDEAFKMFQDKWGEMLERSLKIQQVQNAELKGTEEIRNMDKNNIVTKDVVQLSEKTYVNGGKDYLQQWLDRQVKDKELTKEDADDIMNVMEEAYRISQEMSTNPNFIDYSKWQETDALGEAINSIVSNGDYPFNIDMATVCKKRKALDAVLNALVSDEVFNEYLPSEKCVTEILDEIKSQGFEIACALCFVDAKRYRIGSWAKNLLNGFDTEGKKDGKKVTVHSWGFNEMLFKLAKIEGVGTKKFDFLKNDIENLVDRGKTIDQIELTDKGREFLENIIKTSAKGSNNQIRAQLFLDRADCRKVIRQQEIISSIGFDAMRLQNPTIFDLVKGSSGSATPKLSLSEIAFTNEVLKDVEKKTPEEIKDFRNELRKVGGYRLQSFSDYMANMFFDYVQLMSNFSALKLPAHCYTKESNLVKIFGLTGMKINMSVVPRAWAKDVEERLGQYHGKNLGAKKWEAIKKEYDFYKAHSGMEQCSKEEADYYDKSSDTYWKYMIEDESFDFDEAVKLQNTKGYDKNCGIIFVGVSDHHIRALLRDARVPQVIPYHKSNINPVVAHLRGIAGFNDYTSMQNARIRKKDGKLVNLTADSNKELYEKYKQFNFYDALAEAQREWTPESKLNVAQMAGKKYVDFCESIGVVPKFVEFAYDEEGNFEPNYYKVLADFRLIDSEGNYAPQLAVTMTFPENMTDLVKESVGEAQKISEDFSAKQKSLLKATKKIIERNRQEETKLSSKVSDEEYSRLAKENPEEARKVLDEIAMEHGAISKKGKPVHFYHGTRYRKFNAFDINHSASGWSGYGVYFSADKDFAKEYASKGDEDIYEVYLTPTDLAEAGYRRITAEDIHNFFSNYDISEKSTEAYATFTFQAGMSFRDEVRNHEEGRKIKKTVDEWIDFYHPDDREILIALQELLLHKGYNKFTALNILKDEFGYSGVANSRETVVWFANDIKSADLVTYDDYGREIPLSERFDLSTSDIRYSDKTDIGYHAGDLGKAEPLSIQGYGRGTGHFGSGTYFVGDEKDINIGDYKNRPHEKVDFSKYKLYRPHNKKMGDDLHNFLKVVDGGIRDGWIEHAKSLDFHLYSDYYLGLEANDSIEGWQELANRFGLEYISDRDNYLESIGYTDISEEGGLYHGKDLYGNPWEEYYSANVLNDEYMEYLKNTVLEYTHKENKRYEEFFRYLGEIKYYSAFDRWEEALRKVMEYQKDHTPNSAGASKMDSYATVFMKALGYEGIDVRGYNGLDDTGTGSVIYDLKGEDLARKQEIGRARWSEKVENPYKEVLKTNKHLEKQNEILKEDVKRLRRLIALEKQVTKGTVLNDTKLKSVAEVILKDAQSTYDKSELISRLREVYGLIRNDESIDWDAYMGRVYEIASDIMAKAKPQTIINDEFKNLLSEVRQARIRLTDEQKAKAKENYGDDWRRYFTGKIVFVNDGKSLDEYWAEWSKKNPDIFEADTEDKVAGLFEVYDRIKEASVTMVSFNTEANVKAVANEINNKFWNVPTVTTTADKYTAKINQMKADAKEKADEKNAKYLDEIRELKAKHKDAMKELRESKDAEIKAVRDHKNEVIKLIRERRDEAMAEYVQYRNKKEATLKDFAQRKATINKIYSTIDTLRTWMEKNSAKEHVPEMLKPTVKQLIRAIDFSSKRLSNLEGGTDSTLKSVTQAKENSMRLALEKLNDIAQNLTTEEGMQSLMTYIDFPPTFAQDVMDAYKTANNIAVQTGKDNEYILYSMSQEELVNLLKVVRATKNAVVNLNQTIAGAQRYRISEQAQTDIADLASMGTREKNGFMKKFFEWTNALPEYAFGHLGKGAYNMFTQIKDGWDKFSFNIATIIDFTEKTFNSKEIKEWSEHTHEVEVRVTPTDAEAKKGGEEHTEKIKITDAQIMSIYCLAKRQHAKTHFEGKGIRVGTFEEKNGLKGKKQVVQVKNIRLSETELSNLTGLLTERQKTVADALQNFMNTTCSEWGNEVTMKRFGIEGFTEKNYFPITVDSNALESDPRKNEKSIYALLNMSFTKPIQPRATATMEIGSIFDTFTTHTTEMAKYNALALPLLDMIKYYNYSETDNNGNEMSVKKSIESAYGTQAKAYVNHFLQDLNGMSERGRGDGYLKNFTRMYKTSAVAGNLQVALLQPLAYLRATAVINEKYLLASLAMPHKNEQARKEMLKYSGIAKWKKMSLFDTNVSRGVDSKIKHDDKWYDKAIEISMKGAEVMDELTWGALWNACKLEIKTKQGLKGEELMKATALKFRDVIYKTQVIDTTMTRTDLMRDSSTATQWVTSFMSEPSVTMNVLQDAVIRFNNDRRKYGKTEAFKRNKKVIGRALEAYLLSTVAESVLRTIIGKYRHPDRDEEEMLKDLMAQFIDNVNPMANLPVMRDIISVWRGYDVDRMDMATFKDAYTAYSGWKKVIEGSDVSYNTIFKTAKTVSELTGIPISSLMREVKTIFDNIEEYK